ncbi:MAG: LysE/ArgO family amino acid transporter, partial [Acinetobacter sp.]
MLNIYLQGLAIGLSLCVAIGAQNAFVLKQGLKQQYVFWICLVCAISDSILITLGVTGFSSVVKSHPQIIDLAKYFGILFLILYGAQHFSQAFKGEQNLHFLEQQENSLWKIILICLAFTWLNPHVYLDTVVLIGAISTQYESTKLYFALGAISASWLFFYALGYGARFLLPVFQNPQAWQVLDVV